MKPTILRWAALAAAYVAVSVVCFVAVEFEVLRLVIRALSAWIWTLGPAALLLYRGEFVSIYICGTILVACLIAVNRMLFLRNSERFEFSIGWTLLVWCAFGALAYVPVL